LCVFRAPLHRIPHLFIYAQREVKRSGWCSTAVDHVGIQVLFFSSFAFFAYLHDFFSLLSSSSIVPPFFLCIPQSSYHHIIYHHFPVWSKVIKVSELVTVAYNGLPSHQDAVWSVSSVVEAAYSLSIIAHSVG
jgi:hypothetical protein